MKAELEKLLKKYPIPTELGTPELYDNCLQIDSFEIQLAGLALQTKYGMTVTGSAAEFSVCPVERAYFELLERLSIVDAEASGKSSFTVFDEKRKEISRIDSHSVFPASGTDAWRYAKSNGVAIQTSWEKACQGAKFELIERDRILRSWYGEVKPVELKEGLSLSSLPIQALKKYYDFQIFGFEKVVGVFAFPKAETSPRVSGFGAKPTLEASVEAAFRECMQGLGFLWGEEIPKTIPEASSSPEYHQEYYLHSLGIQKIQSWLNGGNIKHAKSFSAVPMSSDPKDFQFIDLTPEWLPPGLVVVKAIHPSLLPLTFGGCRLHVANDFPEELLIHPIT